MPARRDSGGTQAPFSDRPVHRLLADAEEPRRFFRGDQLRGPAGDALRQEAPVPARGDGGGLEQSSSHGAKNGRPAHAKASC